MAKPVSHLHQLGAKKVLDGGLFDGQPAAVVLGIDQSYTGFGVTVLAPWDGSFFTWCYVSNAKLPGVDRLAELEAFLIVVIATLRLQGHNLADVAMEGYNFGAQRAHQAGELGYAVKRVLRDLDYYPLIVPPMSLKQYITGKGNSAKNEVLLQVFKRWGVEFYDDNMADSFGLAKMATGEATTDYQTKALTKAVREKD